MKTDTLDAGWQKFIDLCVNSKDKSKLESLLKFFLTFEEQEQIAGRIILVQELLKGEKTQREIAKDFDISIAKITRGSNMLKTIDTETRDYLLSSLL